MIELTDRNFDEHLAKPEPLLVKFEAQWCGPCKNMEPVYATVEKDFPYVTFGKLDTDKHAMTTARCRVRGLPATAMFVRGELVAMKAGAMTSVALADFVKKNAQ